MNIDVPVGHSSRLAGLAAEVAFALLPLLVVSMVLLRADRPSKILAAPEWSFGAAILFGQALVRFIAGLARGGDAAKGPVALAVALVVVFGLVPSLFVLNAALEAAEAAKLLDTWLRVSQVVCFALGSAAYMLLGVVGESWQGSK